METVARIPSSLKLRGGEGKYILKKSLEPVLPKDILYRSKQGFGVPLHKWFREDLKDIAYSTIFDKTDGLLDQKYLKKIWNDHQSGAFNRARYLWAVLMFRKWQSTFGA
jgi:asparagine synthase (glutamine-hydrolysing)